MGLNFTELRGVSNILSKHSQQYTRKDWRTLFHVQLAYITTGRTAKVLHGNTSAHKHTPQRPRLHTECVLTLCSSPGPQTCWVQQLVQGWFPTPVSVTMIWLSIPVIPALPQTHTHSVIACSGEIQTSQPKRLESRAPINMTQNSLKHACITRTHRSLLSAGDRDTGPEPAERIGSSHWGIPVPSVAQSELNACDFTVEINNC